MKRVELCVPLVGNSIEAMVAMAKEAEISAADYVELRVDLCIDVINKHSLEELIRAVQGGTTKPLIGTWRSSYEGGHRPISPELYTEYVLTMIESGAFKRVDAEYDFFKNANFHSVSWPQLVGLAGMHGVDLIMSHHNFKETPSRSELEHLLNNMSKTDAPIVKLAVMAQNEEDVTRLKEVSKKFSKKQNCIIISMGELGITSRTHASEFGSILTFGCLPKGASAPGQIAIDELAKIYHKGNKVS